MIEKTSTPDEPDDRAPRPEGSEQAVADISAARTDATGSVPAASVTESAPPTQRGTSPDLTKAKAKASGVVDSPPNGTVPVEEDEPVEVPVVESAESVQERGEIASDAPTVATPLQKPSVDAPTQEVRIPTSGVRSTPGLFGTGQMPAVKPSPGGGGASARPAAAAPVPQPAAAAAGAGTAQQGRPAAAGAPTESLNPPPWHRVPGPNGSDNGGHAPAEQRTPAGVLLDEGPTAFLEAPLHNEAGPQAGERDQAQGPGGWSPMRAVRNRPPRQAALQLRRLDPWSVLKLALVLAVVLFFVWLVAVGVLYGVLDGIGVWDRLNGTYADIVSGEAPTTAPLISAGRVFGLAAVVGAINSLLFAVAMTIGAFVYNVSADLVGGVEVTLSERD